MTIEFSASQVWKVGSVSAGLGLEQVRYPNLPRPRITIWTKVDHWRKFLPLNLWDVIWSEAELKSETIGVACVGANWAVSDRLPLTGLYRMRLLSYPCCSSKCHFIHLPQLLNLALIPYSQSVRERWRQTVIHSYYWKLRNTLHL